MVEILAVERDADRAIRQSESVVALLAQTIVRHIVDLTVLWQANPVGVSILDVAGSAAIAVVGRATSNDGQAFFLIRCEARVDTGDTVAERIEIFAVWIAWDTVSSLS